MSEFYDIIWVLYKYNLMATQNECQECNFYNGHFSNIKFIGLRLFKV